jgi:two-component system, chemotaxis family, protein-glutamate methylesterase/glutaminase
MSIHPARTVLIVDDSAMMRRLVTTVLAREPGLTVCGTASSAEEGWEHYMALRPDAVVLDMELPGRHGFALLERIMRQSPCPVVMISSQGDHVADAAVRSLELGAIDFVDKPNAGTQTIDSFSERLIGLLLGSLGKQTAKPARSVDHSAAPARARAMAATSLIAIGASTGGVPALTTLMRGLRGFRLPILITQHMPAGYTARLALTLSEASGLKAREAVQGGRLEPGTILVAPGGRHLALTRDSLGFCCQLTDQAPVSGHRPSVDLLFQSVANVAGASAAGVLLTGMGSDGAAGLLAMHKVGSRTICQDEASCVVFGMPRSAIELGAADAILPLDSIAPRLREMSHGGAPRPLLRA